MKYQKYTDKIKSKCLEIIFRFYDEYKINSILIDYNSNLIGPANSNWYCKQHFCSNREACKKDHMRVLDESIKWGEPFIYLCYKEFLIFGIPIILNKIFYGGIISGFVLFEQYRKSKDKYIIKDNDKSLKLRYVSNEQIKFLSDELFYLVSQNHLTDIIYLKKQERTARTQREIAEAIIDKKSATEEINIEIYEKHTKLINSIKYSEVEEIRKNLNEALGEIYLESINNINLLKFRMLELFVLITRSMLLAGAKIDSLYKLTENYIKYTENLNDIHSYSAWLKDILNDFISEIILKRKRLGRINKAIDYINQNLNKKVTLSEIASYVGLSKSRFSYLFHKEFGETFSDYILKLKIDKAKELLNNTSYTISDIAYALSFYDQSYFTKVFKKITGNTPKNYLKTEK